MKTILELFSQDEIKVNSRSYEYSKEHLKIYERLEELEKMIIEKLDDEGQKLFDEYNNITSDLRGIIRTEEFIYGYQLGSLMMIDVYSVFYSPAFNE
ncbi:DUF6809 family protein [Clostridium sp. MD294]|uniref:DUF6809 family protein n=1 Tax=Clostridium sp. MD294 TaxID=97138 RepID=UPI0002CAB39C|nr:DUF6809 family protein [Clostridium sp. MD294]NDO46753.1 hypothetical protein [Clostridium sp. MD294]USF28805.1 hypothetical protein C820_000179 [Clostridium sp. MD294]